MIAHPCYTNLALEVRCALTQQYERWIAEHPGDEIYAYIIYATPLASNIAVSVLTEQGVRSVASEYRNKHGYEVIARANGTRPEVVCCGHTALRRIPTPVRGGQRTAASHDVYR